MPRRLLVSQANDRDFWLQFWLQLGHLDLGSRSFAVVRPSSEPPAHQASSYVGGRQRTPSGRPGSVTLVVHWSACDHPRVDETSLWGEYSKEQLPSGWVYPLGRDRISQGLRQAGARVGSLSLGVPDLPQRAGPRAVFDVFWLGGARPGYFGGGPVDSEALLMRWTAVPHVHRHAITAQLEEGWLDRGCEWAAAALVRGNAWSASEHRFLVLHTEGELELHEY